MFLRDSRYARAEIREYWGPDGRAIAYVARRIIRQWPPPVAEIRVQSADRLDRMAERAYAEPRLDWRIKDANPDPAPNALADTPGRALKIAPVPID